jgi:hypothetical protein
MAEPAPLQLALAAATAALRDEKRKYALVGGLAVSVRAEVRFTRDIDLAVGVSDDADAEHLIFALQNRGYQPIATVEHDVRKRLSTIRLLSPQKIKVDLLFASSGIEPEAIDRATAVPLPQVGDIPVAAAEELLARPNRCPATVGVQPVARHCSRSWRSDFDLRARLRPRRAARAEARRTSTAMRWSAAVRHRAGLLAVPSY